jgi:hypothetical protein
MKILNLNVAKCELFANINKQQPENSIDARRANVWENKKFEQLKEIWDWDTFYCHSRRFLLNFFNVFLMIRDLLAWRRL